MGRSGRAWGIVLVAAVVATLLSSTAEASSPYVWVGDQVADEATASVVVVLHAQDIGPGGESVQLTTLPHTADESDYVPVDTVVRFLEGSSDVEVTILIIDDGIEEGDEAFDLRLSEFAPWGDDQAYARVTIRDGSVPVMRMRTEYVREGLAEPRTVPVELRLESSDESPVTVDWQTFDGDETHAGVDYVAASGRATFAPGTVTTTVDITLLPDDDVEEPHAYLEIRMTDAQNLRLPDGPTLVYLQVGDAWPVPVWEVEVSPVAPDAEEAVVLLIGNDTVGPEDGSTFRWRTEDGTALAGRDHVARDETVEIPELNTNVIELHIPLLRPPGPVNGPRSFDVVLDREDGITFATSRIQVVIAHPGGIGSLLALREAGPDRCDVPVVNLGLRDEGSNVVPVWETGVDVRVTPSLGAMANPTRVMYTRLRIVPGTASVAAGDVSWEHHPGAPLAPDVMVTQLDPTSAWGATFRILVDNDRSQRDNRWFDVIIDEVAPEGAIQRGRQRFWLEGTDGVAMTLGNPDGWRPIEVQEGDTRAVDYTVPVEFDRALRRATELEWEISTRDEQDIVTVKRTGTTTLAAGARHADIRLRTEPDEYAEPDELLMIRIVGGEGVVLGAAAPILIHDDDTGPILAPRRGGWRERQIVEEDAGDAVIDLGLLTAGEPGPVVVDWRTRDGSARAGEDFVAAGGTFTLPAGVAAGTTVARVEIPIVADGRLDGAVTETLEIELSRRDGGDLGNPDLLVTVVDSDAAFAARDEAVRRLACGNRERSPWTETTPADVRVVAGDTRDASSVAVSQARFPDDGSAHEVLLANGLGVNGWADALAGAPLAARLRAPLLLVRTEEIPEVVASELDRVLRPGGRVTILGGDQAVGPEVEAQVRVRGFAVRRLAGTDRVDTSLLIAGEFPAPRSALIATGAVFADALSAGAAAARSDGIVLLTPPDRPDPRIEAWLSARPSIARYAVGGPASRAHPEAVAVMGADRSATSVAVADRFFPDATTVGLARSDLAVDALASGPLLAERDAPLLITRSTRLAPTIDEWLCSGHAQIEDGLVFGGAIAIQPPVVEAFRDRLVGECATSAGTDPLPDPGTIFPAAGEWEWELPPSFRLGPELDVDISFPTRVRMGTPVTVVVELCNPNDFTVPVPDRPRLPEEDEQNAHWYWDLGHVGFTPAAGRGAPDPDGAYAYSDNWSLQMRAPHAASDGIQPGECVTEQSTWDQDMRRNDGSVAGLAAPGLWRVDVGVSLGGHGGWSGSGGLQIVP